MRARGERALMPTPEPQISIIGPVFNERDNLSELHHRLHTVLDPLGVSYELIFVDDGSRDGSASAIEQLAKQDPSVRLIEFSRNFGKEAAILAGYDHARGQALIVIDTDLQTPPEVIPQLIERWRAGAEIVDAVRTGSIGVSLLRRMTSSLFYWLLRRLASTEIVAHSVDFRLLDRRVAEELCRCRERFRFNRALVSWLGFRREAVTYVAPERFAGRTRWSFLSLLSYALDAVFSFSSLPLRLAGLFGLLISLLSLIYLVVLMAANLFGRQPMPGYATVVGGIFLLGGVQLLTIWVLGEYVGRLYEEAKERPLYVVRRRIGLDQEAMGKNAS